MTDVAYANGQIPLSALTPLSGGGYLLEPVAAAFEELRIRAARAGHVVALTSVGDAYRSLERQIKVFRERYTILPFPEMGPYGDVRPWDSNGDGVKERWVRVSGPSAAIPGTSNHGWGLAVDISGTGGFSGVLYRWLAANAPALGWSNTEGRSVNESWHWVHTGAWVVSNPIKTGGGVTVPTLPGAPAPITPEEDMAWTAEETAKVNRLLEIGEALVDYTLDGAGRGHEADDRVLGVLPDRRFENGSVAKVLDQLDGSEIVRRSVAETSAAYHQLAALLADDGEALATAIIAGLTPVIGEVQEDVVRDAVNGAIAGLTVAHTSTSTLIPAADET